MDWNKAKNYTILFLFVLNILLIFLNISKDAQYTLKEEQKASIYSVLDKNDIKLVCKIPENFSPMKQFIIKKTNYDIIELQKIFFDDIYNIKRTKEFDKTIFTGENKILTIQNNILIYENKNILNSNPINKEYAENICEEIVSKIMDNHEKMELDRYSENERYFSFYYTQNFIDFSVFNNYTQFKIYKNGTLKMKFEYNEPLESYGNKIDICSADEALFIFMNEIKKIYDDKSISIDTVDIGYFINRIDEDENSSSIVIPHYRIFIDEIEDPFYINAYNNTFVY